MQHGDDRGVFLEWFARRPFRGRDRAPARAARRPTARCSRRGRCAASTSPTSRPARRSTSPALPEPLLDVVVDIRVGSPTFGRWDSVLLDDVDRRAVYVAEGLGHAFMALSTGATVDRTCAPSGYNPGAGARRAPAGPRHRHRLAGRRAAAAVTAGTRRHRRWPRLRRPAQLPSLRRLPRSTATGRRREPALSATAAPPRGCSVMRAADRSAGSRQLPVDGPVLRRRRPGAASSPRERRPCSAAGTGSACSAARRVLAVPAVIASTRPSRGARRRPSSARAYPSGRRLHRRLGERSVRPGPSRFFTVRWPARPSAAR